MRRLALVLLLLTAACGGDNAPETTADGGEVVVDRSAENHRRAIELRDEAAKLITRDNTRAAELAEQAVKLAPDEPTVHEQLGLIHEQLLRYEDAIVSYKRAIELFSGKDRARVKIRAAWCNYKLARAAFDKGDNATALNFTDAAIELNSGDAELYNLKGSIHYKLGEFVAAAEAFGVTADIATGDKVHEALSWKGQSQFHAGAYRPAIETFSRLIDAGVEGYEAYGWRAYCYFQIGMKPEAERDFNQAAQRTTSREKRDEYEAALKALAEAK